MKAKIGLGLILAAMLALFLLPAAALAADELTVTGGTIDEDYVYSTSGGARRVIILTGTPLTISGRPSAASVVIKEGVAANLTLEDATIHSPGGAAIHTYSGATLNLTVVGDNMLTGTGVYAGLNAGSGQKLVITAESTGTLNVAGGDFGAGIGGDVDQDGGTIIIQGGSVNATGGVFGAGIGGGDGGDGGNITISGGTVNATGGEYGGAGIGGGEYGDGGNITISGGTVNATGGVYGAGIGGGCWSGGGNITINGGTVNATGEGGYEGGGAGIGGGLYGSGGDITINGGTVNATGKGGDEGGGAGIGGGLFGNAGDITIDGGTVNATGGENGGAGIGSGNHGSSGGDITINGGTVTATGGGSGAGIGGNLGLSDGNITINGGTVNAKGGENGGAGIGGGWFGGGNITINGGTINAKGGENGGAGIGVGFLGGGGEIKVMGGRVFAAATTPGKDIDYGEDASAARSLEISGDAALFLKNGTCPTPSPTTHTIKAFTGHVADNAVYGIAVPWAGNFSAYLRLCTLSYVANGGSGDLPAVTQHMNTKASVAGGGELRRAGYTFGGWNTAANGGGTDFAAGASFTFAEANVTLFAKWIPYSEPVPAPSGTIINCRSGVNVRSGPGTNYPLLGFAPRGSAYTVLEKAGAWYKVDFGGRVGYISARYLAVFAAQAGHGIVVNCRHSVNVRSGPGTRYSILGSAPKGASYTIIKSFGAWYQIEFSGRTAYISADYFSGGNG